MLYARYAPKGQLLRCNTCHMMVCVPHPNVHNCHYGKGGLVGGSKKGKSTAILQPVKVTKCNILQNVLHCTIHNAHVIIPITCTHWQLYICCCESGHFCQLNCVAVGDGADYGSCWVWLGQKGGSRGEQLLQYSSTLTFTNFDFQNNLCNIVRNILLHSILSV